MKTLNLNTKLASFKDYWKPHRIATVDDMHVLLAKLKGEFIWHAHEEEDELFHVLKGTLHIKFRDRTEVVLPGEIIVIPKGVDHCPYTENEEEVHVLLFEKQKTAHTGKVKHSLTQNTPTDI